MCTHCCVLEDTEALPLLYVVVHGTLLSKDQVANNDYIIQPFDFLLRWLEDLLSETVSDCCCCFLQRHFVRIKQHPFGTVILDFSGFVGVISGTEFICGRTNSQTGPACQPPSPCLASRPDVGIFRKRGEIPD